MKSKLEVSKSEIIGCIDDWEIITLHYKYGKWQVTSNLSLPANIDEAEEHLRLKLAAIRETQAKGKRTVPVQMGSGAYFAGKD